MWTSVCNRGLEVARGMPYGTVLSHQRGKRSSAGAEPSDAIMIVMPRSEAQSPLLAVPQQPQLLWLGSMRVM